MLLPLLTLQQLKQETNPYSKTYNYIIETATRLNVGDELGPSW